MSVPSSSGDPAERMMTDSTDHSANGGVGNDTASSPMMSGPSVGQQLRAGPERAGLSVDDAARALKLSNRQVESLEQDDWTSLPGKTMIRGFVRNYARLVGLDGQLLMSALEGMAMPKSPELRGAEGTPVAGYGEVALGCGRYASEYAEGRKVGSQGCVACPCRTARSGFGLGGLFLPSTRHLAIDGAGDQGCFTVE